MKKMFERRPGVGLLVLRIVLGVVFIAHGYGKLKGIDGVIGFFGSIGLSPMWAYLVSWVELLSGVAMVAGIFTEIAGYLIAIVMLVAIFMVKAKFGFVGGYELDLILLASALAVAWSGPGMLAVPMKKYRMGGCDNCDMCKTTCSRHE